MNDEKLHEYYNLSTIGWKFFKKWITNISQITDDDDTLSEAYGHMLAESRDILRKEDHVDDKLVKDLLIAYSTAIQRWDRERRGVR